MHEARADAAAGGVGGAEWFGLMVSGGVKAPQIVTLQLLSMAGRLKPDRCADRPARDTTGVRDRRSIHLS